VASGHWELKAAPCAIVIHFVNFIIIGFLLRITNLLLVYRLQNLKIRLKKMNIVIVILCVCVRNKYRIFLVF